MLKRYGMIIRVEEDHIAEYKALHREVWLDVLRVISECNLRNYSIFLKQLDDGLHYLFSYFEYVGGDFEADMKRMTQDKTTQEWWKVCKPCQRPLSTTPEGEWWGNMEEVFHHD